MVIYLQSEQTTKLRKVNRFLELHCKKNELATNKTNQSRNFDWSFVSNMETRFTKILYWNCHLSRKYTEYCLLKLWCSEVSLFNIKTLFQKFSILINRFQTWNTTSDFQHLEIYKICDIISQHIAISFNMQRKIEKPIMQQNCNNTTFRSILTMLNSKINPLINRATLHEMKSLEVT